MRGTIVLRRAVFGEKAFLPLSPEKAENLRRAIADIKEMFDVEQKFDIVLANFVELEQEVANRALHFAFYSEHNGRALLEDKQAFNRRTINFLTAAKLYIDQAKHHIKAFFADNPGAGEALDRAFTDEYDGHLGYRVMEALRNYSQHRGLPLQGLSHHARWLNMNTPERVMEFNVSLNLVTAELTADGKFKASVLKELHDRGKTIDIKLMIRQYVECLGRAHTRFRELVKARIDAARATLVQTAAEFTAICTESDPLIGLAVAQQHEDGTYTVLDYYPSQTLEYLDILQNRSRMLANLSRRRVSTGSVETENRP